MKFKTTVKIMNNKNKKQKKKTAWAPQCQNSYVWATLRLRGEHITSEKEKKTLVDFFLENHPSYSFDRDRQGKTRWWLSRGNRSKTHQAPSHEDVFYFFFFLKKGQIKNDSNLPRVIPICLNMVRCHSMGKQEPQFIYNPVTYNKGSCDGS